MSTAPVEDHKKKFKASLFIFKNLKTKAGALHLFHLLFYSAARLYPTRQAPGPQPQSSGGGASSSGGAGGGGGLSSRAGFLRRSNNSKTSKASSTSAVAPNYAQQNANFANYQNCTIVRSHTPHANYGYVKVAPKILIFPIFVQVIYLLFCSLSAIDVISQSIFV